MGGRRHFAGRGRAGSAQHEDLVRLFENHQYFLGAGQPLFLYRTDGDAEAFLESDKVTVIMSSGTSKEMFAIPSNTIIDGVQCAFKNGLKFSSVSSSVYLGFTYVGEVEGDSGSYSGLVVTR